jgi:hypothetical protein
MYDPIAAYENLETVILEDAPSLDEIAEEDRKFWIARYHKAFNKGLLTLNEYNTFVAKLKYGLR